MLGSWSWRWSHHFHAEEQPDGGACGWCQPAWQCLGCSLFPHSRHRRGCGRGQVAFPPPLQGPTPCQGPPHSIPAPQTTDLHPLPLSLEFPKSPSAPLQRSRDLQGSPEDPASGSLRAHPLVSPNILPPAWAGALLLCWALIPDVPPENPPGEAPAPEGEAEERHSHTNGRSITELSGVHRHREEPVPVLHSELRY